jgi:hypothetical protein
MQAKVEKRHSRFSICSTQHRFKKRKGPGLLPGCTAREEGCSDGGSGITDIQILWATAFDNIQASEQVVGTFFLRLGDCIGLLGGTVEGITDGE